VNPATLAAVMTPKRRETRALVAVLSALALAAAANGCEIIANFDTSLIPAEGGGDASYSLDGYSAADVGTSEDTGIGTGPDSGPQGDGAVDSSIAADSSQGTDGTIADSTAADTSVADSKASDTSVADTNAPDTNAPDTSAPDTSAPDTSVEDASDDGG
jgi:hypothetical protein